MLSATELMHVQDPAMHQGAQSVHPFLHRHSLTHTAQHWLGWGHCGRRG